MPWVPGPVMTGRADPFLCRPRLKTWGVAPNLWGEIPFLRADRGTRCLVLVAPKGLPARKITRKMAKGYKIHWFKDTLYQHP